MRFLSPAGAAWLAPRLPRDRSTKGSTSDAPVVILFRARRRVNHPEKILADGRWGAAFWRNAAPSGPPARGVEPERRCQVRCPWANCHDPNTSRVNDPPLLRRRVRAGRSHNPVQALNAGGDIWPVGCLEMFLPRTPFVCSTFSAPSALDALQTAKFGQRMPTKAALHQSEW